MKLKVKRVSFHNSDNHIQGLGNVPKVLPSQIKTFPNLEMFLDASIHPGVIFLNIGAHKTSVSLVNVQLMELEETPSDTKNSSSDKSKS